MTPHFCGQYNFLGMPEEVCRNGLPGVERDGVCCEAQCGTCGGSGCAGRPGGPVRWCFAIFASCPLVSHAVGEACSLVCPFPRNGEKVADTEGPTLRLATGGQERVQNSAPPTSAGVASSRTSVPRIRQYDGYTLRTRRRGYHNHVDVYWSRLGA